MSHKILVSTKTMEKIMQTPKHGIRTLLLATKGLKLGQQVVLREETKGNEVCAEVIALNGDYEVTLLRGGI